MPRKKKTGSSAVTAKNLGKQLTATNCPDDLIGCVKMNVILENNLREEEDQIGMGELLLDAVKDYFTARGTRKKPMMTMADFRAFLDKQALKKK